MVSPVRETKHVFERLLGARHGIKAHGVRRLGLFGSFVRGKQDDDSDVDLLVEFEPQQKSFDNLDSLADLLEEVLQRRVELVTVESLSPYLGPRILAETVYVSLDD